MVKVTNQKIALPHITHKYRDISRDLLGKNRFVPVAIIEQKQKLQKHTTAGIRQWSPT
jgi:hypothetical protein